jgi:hypothetical protein
MIAKTAPDTFPTLPPRSRELFEVVFVRPAQELPAQLPPAVIVEANAYRNYVHQVTLRLNVEAQRFAATTSAQQSLGGKAQELLQAESRRKGELAPFLGEEGKTAHGTRGMPAVWRNLQTQLRQDMLTELSAIRDARLQLEFRKADLVNQQPGLRARVILRGGAQVHLFFTQRKTNAAKKG